MADNPKRQSLVVGGLERAEPFGGYEVEKKSGERLPFFFGGGEKSAFYAPILRFFGKKQVCCVQGREFGPFSLLYNSQKNKKTTKKY